ncbi:MAG: hypothetical protein ACK5NY_03445 [Burkholderiaceae bacterium]
MTKAEILAKIEARYTHAVNSTQYSRWRRMAEDAYRFYDGLQWTDEEMEILMARGQPPVVINRIAQMIDSVVGQELQTRTRIAYRPRTLDQTDRLLAEAATALAYQTQELEDTSYKRSLSGKDCLIGGIGWICLTNSDGRPRMEHIDPFEMVWDADDTSSDLSKALYVHRHRMLDILEAKRAFPAYKQDLDDLMTTTGVSNADQLPFAATGGYDDSRTLNYADPKLDKVRIIHTQYKKAGKAYRFMDASKRMKQVLEYDVALEFAESKDSITEVAVDEIWEAFWTHGILMYHAPAASQTGELEYLPLVYKRRKNDLVPYGLVEQAKDPQVEFNKRRSKMMHLLNTQGVIADATAIDDPNQLRAELAKPNFVLLKKQGTELRLENNLQLAQGQLQVMNQAALDIQAASGVYEEFMGQETNATSGLAIGRRQLSTTKGKAFFFDTMRRYQKNMGRLLLALMQAAYNEQTVIAVMGDQSQEGREIILNQPSERNGRTYFVNDFATANFDVYVEEVPEYDAPPHEVREAIMQIAGNGQWAILGSPELAAQLGIRNAKEIAKAVAPLIGASQQSAEAPTATGTGQMPAMPSPIMGGSGE